MKKLFILSLLLLLTSCISSQITPAQLFASWKTSYNKDVDVFYEFNCSGSKVGDEPMTFTPEELIIFYTPKESPYTILASAKGSLKLDGKVINSIINIAGNTKFNKGKFKVPNYKGERIQIKIISLIKDKLTVNINGKLLIFYKFQDLAEIYRNTP